MTLCRYTLTLHISDVVSEEVARSAIRKLDHKETLKKIQARIQAFLADEEHLALIEAELKD